MRPSGCQSCMLRPSLCHGEDGGLGLDGCITLDHSKCAALESTCLCNPSLLHYRLREVGGFDCELAAPLRPVAIGLPDYIPTIYYPVRSTKPIKLDWVALPLHALLASDGTFRARFRDGKDLRESLHLAQGTRIVITGPGPDQTLETFWRYHRKNHLPEALLNLGVEVFTVPNYSFFLDQPPLHHRYNRSRILRVAERTSAAGLSVVLHLNALHEEEWRDWEELLKRHTEIKFICLEFHTGYRNPVFGDKAFGRLVQLQRAVGRPLHPILIGGARYADRLGKEFESRTIIDGQPFMKTIRRRICLDTSDGNVIWKLYRSAPGECLDGRLVENIGCYSRRIKYRLSGKRSSRQSEFPFYVCSRRLTARCAQEPVTGLPLFAPSTPASHGTLHTAQLANSLPPSQRQTWSRNGTVEVEPIPRARSATNLSSLRRKRNSQPLQPSES